MAYGNYNRGGYGNSGGGYQRNNYGGGQQVPPPPPLIDVHQEIKNRFDLYQQFKDVAVNEYGITPDDFLIMSPLIGGWVTSVLLKQEKGK